MAVEKLNGLKPEPQIISSSDTDLRLLRDIGRARTALSLAVVKIEQASNRCDKPHVMRQITLLRLLKCMLHGRQEYPALFLLLFCCPVSSAHRHQAICRRAVRAPLISVPLDNLRIPPRFDVPAAPYEKAPTSRTPAILGSQLAAGSTLYLSVRFETS